MYRSAFWMVHICLFGCQAGGHLWSVQCLVSLDAIEGYTPTFAAIISDGSVQ